MDQPWYYESNGKQEPTTLDALRQMCLDGRLTGTTLVWREGLPNWTPAAQTDELRDVALSPPAPAGLAPAAPASAAAVGNAPLQYSMPHPEDFVISVRAATLFHQTRPWVRLVSIVMWVGVALMILGGVGFLLAAVAGAAAGGANATWAVLVPLIAYVASSLLYVMPALYLHRYASRLAEFQRLNRGDVLESAIEAQKSFWKFCGIVLLVVLGLYAVGILFVLLATAFR